MNRTLEIVGQALGIGVVLGVGGWWLLRALRRSEDRRTILFKCGLSLALGVGEYFLLRRASGSLAEGGGLVTNAGPALVMTGSLAVAGILLSIIWTPHLSEALVRPLTSLFDGGNEPPEPKPYYSIAHARRRRRQFLEAIVEIRKQLARFPDDLEGVLLLAGIQADDLKDLVSAEITLNHFCNQPDVPPRQFAAALNQLADWHLKLAQDADSARAALQRIVERFPGTEVALLAAQRIAHLAGAAENVLAAGDRQPVPVPEGVANVGLLDSSAFLKPEETDPGKLAAACVQHLAQHPLDTEIREKLALIYADHYQRLDLATGELRQLIDLPAQPAKRVAHWLNLLADRQIRLGADYAAVQQTLEEIVTRFPTSAVAELARTRLGRLKLEFKARGQEQTVKLGVYEQNIGLKHGPPPRG